MLCTLTYQGKKFVCLHDTRSRAESVIACIMTEKLGINLDQAKAIVKAQGVNVQRDVSRIVFVTDEDTEVIDV